MESTIEIRRVRDGEGSRLREIRLRALADSPHAFYSALNDEVTRPLAEWERRAASQARGSEEAMFVAVKRDEWVGMAGGFRDPTGPETVKAWAGWVDPRVRARGLGLALVEAVVDWAQTTGASRIEVAVAENNDQALSFCRRAGFAPTGEVKPVPWDPTVKGLFMERALAPSESLSVQPQGGPGDR